MKQKIECGMVKIMRHMKENVAALTAKEIASQMGRLEFSTIQSVGHALRQKLVYKSLDGRFVLTKKGNAYLRSLKPKVRPKVDEMPGFDLSDICRATKGHASRRQHPRHTRDEAREPHPPARRRRNAAGA